MQHSDLTAHAHAHGGSNGTNGSGGSAVVCEFVRQRCTHDALFQPFYKRSNRTKGSKILRCFPHCCPNHAHRGFCGSSLHVRVEWPSASTGLRSAPPPPPPPSIHVLGRFRLSDTPPLPLGHCLSATVVFGAVQSDDTPNGEWIDSQMIYSWSETNWLFEINSAARWFYGWESSTVKSQRLKDHVLDIYVFASSSPSSANASASSSAGSDVLRVVAAATSPSFQLISFRRATGDAMLALSATHHVRQQLQNGGAGGADLHHQQMPPPRQQYSPPEEKPTVAAMGPRLPLVHYHADAASAPPIHTAPPPPSRPLRLLHAPHTHTSVPVTRPLSLPSLRPPLLSSAAASTGSSGQWTAPPLGSSMISSHPLSTLAPLHRPAPPSFRAFAPSPQMQAPPQTRPLMLRPAAFAPPLQSPALRADARAQTAWHPPQLSIARPAPSAASTSSSSAGASVSGGRDSAAWEIANLFGQLHQIPLADAFERVAWIHETYAQHATEYAAAAADDDKENKTDVRPVVGVEADAEMSVRRALASLGLHASPRKLPSRLLSMLTELALWLLFDQMAIRQLQGAARSATTTLADPALVQRYYRRAVFFLHDHIGRFLDRRFQTTIRDVVRECELLGLDVQREEDAPTATSPGAAISGARAMKGQDTFVAQAREELVVARTTVARTKRRRLADTTSSVAAFGPPKASSPSLLNRQWACSLNDVRVHRSGPHTHTPQPSDASLLTLLWFYRQFSVVSLTLVDATLDVRSLFVLSSPLCSQFVLDGADRFLHAFPAGEATLATSVGRYTFGDYVGEIDHARDHHQQQQTIRLRLYAFLTPTKVPSNSVDSATDLPLERIAADACVSYHVTLRPSASGLSTAADATLSADVVVEVGALDVAALRHGGYSSARTLLREMTTWSLRQKLAAVRSFEETSRVQLLYRPQGTV